MAATICRACVACLDVHGAARVCSATARANTGHRGQRCGSSHLQTHQIDGPKPAATRVSNVAGEAGDAYLGDVAELIL